MSFIKVILTLLCGVLSPRVGCSQRLLEPECVTGYMTDVQSWVDAEGVLTQYVGRNGLDLSGSTKPVPELQKSLASMRTKDISVKYLSLASCQLSRIPAIFHITDSRKRSLSETLQYMTFYGNRFRSFDSEGNDYDVFLNVSNPLPVSISGSNPKNPGIANMVWSSGLQKEDFPRLKELDLRNCSIQSLGARLFRGMPNLEALYIGENEIFTIQPDTFSGLNKLQRLDFSRNHPTDSFGNPLSLMSDSIQAMTNLPSLITLDLSHTKLTPRNFGMIRGFGKNLKVLSLCNSGLFNIHNGLFDETPLEILDISRNNGILGAPSNSLGLQNSLVVLFAKEIGLQSFEILKGYRKLEIAQLSNNELTYLRPEVAKSLTSLLILDLNKNRLTSWFRDTFSLMKRLKFLSFKDNNLNVITEQMIEDIKNVDYAALSGNSLVCNCNVNDLFRMAAANEELFNETNFRVEKTELFHTGFVFYNHIINSRKRVSFDCGDYCEDMEDTGRFRLIDNFPGYYTCLKIPESKSVLFSEVVGCNMLGRDIEYEAELASSRRVLLTLLVIPFVLLPLLFVFVFRRNLRYCLITMRNSAMLSLINKNEVVEENTIYNYDVFVSYCNEDRGWVLDHLLPHMEAECSVSACLHERDFQVGLSILENIVSCMDRSRLIMLIISQQFLLSQWCQFEMHLAQHRLLETRREDLILVLLEEIPRRLRPNTLQYLMLTKTYIVWPKDNTDTTLFWRRLKKSLLSPKSKQIENVSLA